MTDEIDISRADLSKDEQIALLRSSVERWNEWRHAHPEIQPDLSKANLLGTDLNNADLSGANLNRAILNFATMTMANVSGARLGRAELTGTSLVRANLRGAYLIGATLLDAKLIKADLTGTNLIGAALINATLSGAILHGANLRGTDLRGAQMDEVDLRMADLSEANLVHTHFEHATLDGCRIYGISAWNVYLDKTTQANLCITPLGEPEIRVDNLQVAQFLYLLLHNEEVRDVLDTITSKVVLILGRFSKERKPALDALRAALRQHTNGYIPVLFDFEPQTNKPVLDTVKILANLARFVIADLTDPNMVRSELTVITEHIPTVPIQPLIEGDAKLPTEYMTWREYRSFLKEYRYTDLQQLLAHLDDAVIAPVEQHVQARRLTDLS